jgi:hypothetical protein
MNMDMATCWVGGRIGGALAFDGVNDYVSIPHSAELCPQNEITVEVWINPEYIPSPTAPSGKDWGIISKGNAISTTNESYSLTLRGSSIEWRPIYSNTLNGGGVVGGTIAANTWAHVVGVYKAGVFSGVYVNGSLVGSMVPLNESLRQTPSYPLLIGRGNQNPYSHYFNGKIDEVRIYNRALMADEIYNHYLDGLSGF